MRSGDRSPPAASNPFGSSSADSSGGNGLSRRSHVIMMLATETAWRNDFPVGGIDLPAPDHRLAHTADAKGIRRPKYRFTGIQETTKMGSIPLRQRCICIDRRDECAIQR